MQEILHFLNVDFLINTFGYPGLFFIIFAETGLMLGFFLPGDSLILTAGIFAAKGIFNLPVLCVLLFTAAVLGNIAGYAFGKHVGKPLLEKEGSGHRKHLLQAKAFFDKHGGKTIILARFIPIVRTFAPIVAGISDMSYATFTIYNIIGSLLWTTGLTLSGYFVGQLIPAKYFEVIIFTVVIVSVLPGLYHMLKTKEQRQAIFSAIKSFIKR